MSLDFRPAFQDIRDALTDALPNVEIIKTHDDVVIVNGVVKPYLVLLYGGPIRRAEDRGIVGSKRDTNLYWLSVECTSESEDIAQDLKAEVVNALTDFQPTDSGRLTLDGGYAYSRASTVSVPTRIIESVHFSFAHNLQN